MLFISPVNNNSYIDTTIKYEGKDYHIHVCNFVDSMSTVMVYDEDYEAIAILTNYIFMRERVYWDTLYMRGMSNLSGFPGFEEDDTYEKIVETICYDILPDIIDKDGEEYFRKEGD